MVSAYLYGLVRVSSIPDHSRGSQLSPFHGGNRGSNPRGDANIFKGLGLEAGPKWPACPIQVQYTPYRILANPPGNVRKFSNRRYVGMTANSRRDLRPAKVVRWGAWGQF